jgi:hypothetical protein
MTRLGLLLLLLTTQSVWAQTNTPDPYPPDTVLVVAPNNYPFAAVQISGGIPGAVVVETSLVQAFGIAKADTNVTGVIDINLATDQAWETVRVVCYASPGEKRWEERDLQRRWRGPAHRREVHRGHAPPRGHQPMRGVTTQPRLQ